MSTAMKLSYTLLNAVSWGVVLVPILFVDQWLEAIKRRNADKSD
jgi:hypothetical protein